MAILKNELMMVYLMIIVFFIIYVEAKTDRGEPSRAVGREGRVVIA